MADREEDVPDKVLARALGEEIRIAREANGWTRLQMVERLPSQIGDRTLLSYEHGLRHLTVIRLIELCRELGEEAPAMLNRALRRAHELRTVSLKVDLDAVRRDQRSEFAPVRRWAIKKLRDDPDSAKIKLPPSAVRELAGLLGYSQFTLADYLARFSL